jgi:CheY-like chemotaxis protein
MSGIELFERVVDGWPALHGRFILMSGDAGAADITRFAEGTGVAVLAKPFDMRTLTDAVREVASR